MLLPLNFDAATAALAVPAAAGVAAMLSCCGTARSMAGCADVGAAPGCGRVLMYQSSSIGQCIVRLRKCKAPLLVG